MLGTWFHEQHPVPTDILFLLFVKNLLIVHHFGLKRLLNTLNGYKTVNRKKFALGLNCGDGDTTNNP